MTDQHDSSLLQNCNSGKCPKCKERRSLCECLEKELESLKEQDRSQNQVEDIEFGPI